MAAAFRCVYSSTTTLIVTPASQLDLFVDGNGYLRSAIISTSQFQVAHAHQPHSPFPPPEAFAHLVSLGGRGMGGGGSWANLDLTDA